MANWTSCSRMSVQRTTNGVGWLTSRTSCSIGIQPLPRLDGRNLTRFARRFSQVSLLTDVELRFVDLFLGISILYRGLTDIRSGMMDMRLCASPHSRSQIHFLEIRFLISAVWLGKMTKTGNCRYIEWRISLCQTKKRRLQVKKKSLRRQRSRRKVARMARRGRCWVV